MGLGVPHVIGKSSEVVRLVTKGFEMSCPQDDLWDRVTPCFHLKCLPRGFGNGCQGHHVDYRYGLGRYRITVCCYLLVMSARDKGIVGSAHMPDIYLIKWRISCILVKNAQVKIDAE